MASTLPARLRTPELARFVTRAAQLANFRPIVTYWLEYYVLQTILQKSLHTIGDDCSAYAVQLMDKLEAYKSTNANEPAVTDDITAKAYIESFALDTFAKADSQQTENRVGKQTADTFMAAATFLDLLAVWGPLDEEARAKSKFAKFHALRIAKALKAGEDPNATNPVIEKPVTQDPVEEGLDQELEAMSQQQNGTYIAPTVEDAGGDHMVPEDDSIDPNTVADTAPENQRVSPVDAAVDESTRQNSIGGGYFPSVPETPTTEETAYNDAAPDPLSPTQFYNAATPSLPPPSAVSLAPPPSTVRSALPPPEHMTAQPPALPPSTASLAVHTAIPLSGGYNTDDEAVAAAQKHAKWAISALNFEDVNTAVKELKIALAALGAT